MKKRIAISEFLGGLAKRPQAFVAAAVPLALPILLAAVNVAEPAAAPATLATVTAPQLRYDDLRADSPATLPEHSLLLTIEQDDTLDSVLLAGGLSGLDAAALTRELGKSIDVHRLRPGHLLRFHYDAAGKVDSVEMKVNGWGELDAVRNPAGSQAGDFRPEPFSVTSHVAEQREIESVVSGDISGSLYESLRVAGEGPQLAQALVDVFQWDIDFFALQKGDSFSLVVRKKYAGADPNGYGPITAARFTHAGQNYEAFRHEGEGGAGYYARNGAPLRKQFLRAPLQFTRITSKFSNHRFHPLLHYFRPHHGVDYGAPAGTPVMTTADGTVVAAQYNHGEGNYVKIRHSARIETMYLHLSRFAKGIKPGRRVTQGEVIGYVGMTGLATGPHLDYRVSDGGTWLDPLKLRSITPDPLRGDALAAFRRDVGQLGSKLAAPSQQLAEYAAKRRALF
jgi:murein DD-endopeptidase MepM/ murein hydrolase activator NlpD